MGDIRPAGPEDAETLTRIAQAAKRHWGYPEAWMELWRSALTLTPEFVEGHPTYCEVEGHAIRGFYAMSREGSAFELEHMWVDPAHFRQGVGRRLMAHAMDTARAGGGTSLLIASDPNAAGFYEHMGGRRVGTTPSVPAGRVLPVLIVDLTTVRAR